MFFNVNRDPKKVEPANASDFYHFKEKPKDSLSSLSANAFWSCVADKSIPAWAVPLCPIEELKKLKNGDRVVKPRILTGEGVVLFAPRIYEGHISAELSVVANAKGPVTLVNPDTGEEYLIRLDDLSDRWSINESFERLKTLNFQD